MAVLGAATGTGGSGQHLQHGSAHTLGGARAPVGRRHVAGRLGLLAGPATAAGQCIGQPGLQMQHSGQLLGHLQLHGPVILPCHEPVEPGSPQGSQPYLLLFCFIFIFALVHQPPSFVLFFM